MGLDVGDKRIGVAVSDPLGLTAQGLKTILRQSLKQDVKSVAELAAAWEAQLIVIGLPRSLNNTLGPQAEKVQQFARSLADSTGLPQTYLDERFTTSLATQTLLLADVSRRKRKQVVDMLAAQLILQSYLDRTRPKETSDCAKTWPPLAGKRQDSPETL